MHESLDHDQSLAGGPRLVPAVATSDDHRDRALIARVAAGDELAFEQLVRLHRPRLLRIAERVVDAGRAEDAVQIALLRAYQSFSGGEIPRQPSAWLSAITRNAAIDQQRRRGPVDPVAEPGRDASSPSVASIAESRAELRDVLRDVAALPEHEREALLMRATVGAGHEAIGAQLSVSPGQARQLLHRARRRLREVAAVLLPAWLAFRVSQARAAVTNLAAAPSETVLSTKGAALAVAAAATIGGGGAALQATRASDRPGPADATSQSAGNANAALNGTPVSAAGAAALATGGAGASAAGQAAAGAGGKERSARAGDARNAAEKDAPRGPGAAHGSTGTAPDPSTTGAAADGGDDDDATDDRPNRGDDASGSGSGSSGSGKRDDDDDRDEGSSNSGPGSSNSGRDDEKDGASSSGSGASSDEASKAEDSSKSGENERSESSGSSDSEKVEDRQRDDEPAEVEDEPDERSGRSAEDE